MTLSHPAYLGIESIIQLRELPEAAFLVWHASCRNQYMGNCRLQDRHTYLNERLECLEQVNKYLGLITALVWLYLFLTDNSARSPATVDPSTFSISPLSVLSKKNWRPGVIVALSRKRTENTCASLAGNQMCYTMHRSRRDVSSLPNDVSAGKYQGRQ